MKNKMRGYENREGKERCRGGGRRQERKGGEQKDEGVKQESTGSFMFCFSKFPQSSGFNRQCQRFQHAVLSHHMELFPRCCLIFQLPQL